VTDPTVSAPDLEQVRRAAKSGDTDRYLAALLAPRDVRNDLIVLAAFAGEMARIPHLVREPMIGEIRLQWWRDALLAPTGEAAGGNPVAEAMRDVMRRRALPEGLVAGPTEARSFDLYSDPMPDEQTFRAYLAKTEGAVFELGLRILGGADSAGIAAAADAGQARGVARVLAELPAFLSRGRCPLPLDRLDMAGLSPADLAAVPLRREVADFIATFRDDARRSLGSLRRVWAGLSPRQKVALLPVAMVEPQLRVLERPAHHPGRDVSAVLPLTRVWRLWQARVTGRI